MKSLEEGFLPAYSGLFYACRQVSFPHIQGSFTLSRKSVGEGFLPLL